jgi:hypothetical protein
MKPASPSSPPTCTATSASGPPYPAATHPPTAVGLGTRQRPCGHRAYKPRSPPVPAPRAPGGPHARIEHQIRGSESSHGAVPLHPRCRRPPFLPPPLLRLSRAQGNPWSSSTRQRESEPCSEARAIQLPPVAAPAVFLVSWRGPSARVAPPTHTTRVLSRHPPWILPPGLSLYHAEKGGLFPLRARVWY